MPEAIVKCRDLTPGEWKWEGRDRLALTRSGPLTSVASMEHLHAPWRIEYILAPKPRADQSVFTRLAQSSADEDNHVLVRERTCFALLNTYPYNGGHLMIIPYKETADLDDLTDPELLELMRLTRRCINALKRTMHPDGFNVGVNLGALPAPASSSTCTFTWCRAGTATRTSCPCWPAHPSCPRP